MSSSEQSQSAVKGHQKSPPDSSPFCVASVVLNYNSDVDLMASVPQLYDQQGIEHSLIIVDNASSPECVRRTQAWIGQEYPDVISGTFAEVLAWVRINSETVQVNDSVYLILNSENLGYSAGNNVGIRLAEVLGANAVLIANPDMRFDNPYYLVGLAEVLFTDRTHYIAASRIVDADGEDQNPSREAGFWDELFWPRFYLSKFLKPISHVLPISGNDPVRVPKVSGCCLLLRMSFLRATEYLDEGVFLYCEEPILAARVREYNGKIVYVPSLSAVHDHIRSEKGNSSRRMQLFIKSRRYYLERYSGYGHIRITLLFFSYWGLAAIHKIKERFTA